MSFTRILLQLLSCQFILLHAFKESRIPFVMVFRLLFISGIITTGVIPVLFIITVFIRVLNAEPLPHLRFDIIWVVPIVGSLMVAISFLHRAGIFTKKRQYDLLKVSVLGTLVFCIGFGLLFTGIFYAVDKNIQSLYCEISENSKQDTMLHHGHCVQFTVKEGDDFIKRNLGYLQ